MKQAKLSHFKQMTFEDQLAVKVSTGACVKALEEDRVWVQQKKWNKKTA